MENFNNIDFSWLYENFVHNQLKNKYKMRYWRTTAKTEVDLIVENSKIIPIEVKTTSQATRAIRSFMSNYNLDIGIIANLKTGEKTEKMIYSVPFVYF